MKKFPTPVNLLSIEAQLPCACCGENLFTSDPGTAMVQFVRDGKGTIYDCRPCHKGECDRSLEKTIPGYCVTDWVDLDLFTNPLRRLRNEVHFVQQLNHQDRNMTDEAEEHYLDILIATAPYACREPSDEERERFEKLVAIG